jgi:hypothetical protein
MNLVTWTSQKQRVVALSSCEAEYIASAGAACQGVWLSRLFGELLGMKAPKVNLLVDNKSVIALSENPVHHERSKHIDTKYHFVRDCIEDASIDINHVSTHDQLADILTKALGNWQGQIHRAEGAAGSSGCATGLGGQMIVNPVHTFMIMHISVSLKCTCMFIS